MSRLPRWLIPVVCVVVVLGACEDARAQADPQNYQFHSGQTIQPFFDGWTHNPDGGFDMYFGYLNRNWVDATHVPVGANNRMTPDTPDQGQPTFFYPRTHHRMFSVTVPADWGDKRLVWQVTVGNETFRAEGWLQPEWEIDTRPRNFSAATEGPANQAPTMVVDAAPTATVAGTLTMTATVSDDGLPPARERRGGGQGLLPTFEEIPEGPTLPVNVPHIQADNRLRPTRVRVERVNVTWTQLRGPTGVTLQSQDEEPQDGMAKVDATFETPGDYLFRVAASDGPETVIKEFTVTVR